MKKVCVVTAARSEYGLLRWLIDEVHRDADLELQLVVTGMHLSPEFGYTYREIEQDGYPIAAKIEMDVTSGTREGIAASMGACSAGLAGALSALCPDILVVLGDRYELLPVCGTALVMEIPIAHISGGDVTEGALDNRIRNAVTMLADVHFPGNGESASNIARMTGSGNNIFNVGEPGLDNFKKLCLLSREELAGSLKIDPAKKWVMVTYHPETTRSLEYNLTTADDIIRALEHAGPVEVIITKANSDFGGAQINKRFREAEERDPGKFKLFPSLGQLRYLSFMKEAACVVGNSSSGIVEAPALGTPVLNIGDRQKGRYLAANVTSVPAGAEVIREAMESVLSGTERYAPDNYYGDGTASVKIKEHIKEFLNAR